LSLFRSHERLILYLKKDKLQHIDNIK